MSKYSLRLGQVESRQRAQALLRALYEGDLATRLLVEREDAPGVRAAVLSFAYEAESGEVMVTAVGGGEIEASLLAAVKAAAAVYVAPAAEEPAAARPAAKPAAKSATTRKRKTRSRS